MKIAATSLAFASIVMLWCGTARATYCGAVSYLNAHHGGGGEDCKCAANCLTTVKTRHRVVFVPETRTVTKTVLERVVEPKSVTVVQHIPETRYRDEVYTVTKPVWETRIKQVPYTVMRPVWETCVKQVPYTVIKPIWETRAKQIAYTVMKPVWETCVTQDSDLHGNAARPADCHGMRHGLHSHSFVLSARKGLGTIRQGLTASRFALQTSFRCPSWEKMWICEGKIPIIRDDVIVGPRVGRNMACNKPSNYSRCWATRRGCES